jgi:hypothetical protein
MRTCLNESSRWACTLGPVEAVLFNFDFLNLQSQQCYCIWSSHFL